MQSVFTDFFIFRDGNVKDFSYRFDDNERMLRLRPANDGQESQPLTPDFWKWWEENVNFIPEVHQVDFVIISDTNPSLLQIPNDYAMVNPTKWTLPIIQSVCNQLFKDENAEVFENEVKLFDVKNGFSGAYKPLYINRFNLPPLDTPNTRNGNSNQTDPFLDYLANSELPPIIIKDITR